MKAYKKKPLMESFREHIGLMIDRIDPLELAAVCAGTVVIHETIKGSTELLGRLGKLAQAGSQGTGGLSADFFNYLGLAFGQVNIFNLEQGKVAWTPQDITKNEYMLIGVSFLAAWYLFKRGGITDNVISAGLPAILTSIGL